MNKIEKKLNDERGEFKDLREHFKEYKLRGYSRNTSFKMALRKTGRIEESYKLNLKECEDDRT